MEVAKPCLKVVPGFSESDVCGFAISHFKTKRIVCFSLSSQGSHNLYKRIQNLLKHLSFFQEVFFCTANISLVFHVLRCLPVHFYVQFKGLVLTYQVLSRLDKGYQRGYLSL